ncbi:DUF6249 domain-containing protein [Roseateles asaccharophilus]|nr:DUF6249 domain-containing protein [Roseateles asaccharophilus]
MEFLPMLLIPGVVLLAPVLLTALVLRYRRARAEMRYEFLLKLAQSGVAVPPMLPGEATQPPSDLRRALVLLAGGIGLSLTLLVLPLHYHVGRPLAELWGLGLLPMALGLGYLTHWFLSRRGGGHG